MTSSINVFNFEFLHSDTITNNVVFPQFACNFPECCLDMTYKALSDPTDPSSEVAGVTLSSQDSSSVTFGVATVEYSEYLVYFYGQNI